MVMRLAMPGMPSPTNHIMMVMAGGAGNQVMGLHPVCVDAASNGNGNGQSAVASSQHATVFSTVDALFGLVWLPQVVSCIHLLSLKLDCRT